jgi:predicted sugar kinase
MPILKVKPHKKAGAPMDIAALSVMMNQSQVQQQASLSVMKMAINTTEQNSANFTKMLEQSVQPHLGSKFDLKL